MQSALVLVIKNGIFGLKTLFLDMWSGLEFGVSKSDSFTSYDHLEHIRIFPENFKCFGDFWIFRD